MAFEFWFDYNPIPDMPTAEWLRRHQVIGAPEEVSMEVTIKVDTTGVTGIIDAHPPLVDSSTIADLVAATGTAAAIGAAAAQAASCLASVDFGVSAALWAEAKRGLDDFSATVAQAVTDIDFLFLPQLESIEEQDMPPPKPNPLGFVYIGNDTWLPEKLHTKRRQVQYQEASRPQRPLWPGPKPRRCHLKHYPRRKR